MANINSLNINNTLLATRPYGTCSTVAGTAAKVVVMNDFDSMHNGASIIVKFDNANTAANPTLNVNSKGAKSIKWNGSALPSSQHWAAGAVIEFIFDGTSWNMIGAVKDNNTTSFTITANAVDDDVVVLSGTNGTKATTYTASHAKTYGNTTAPYTATYTSGNSTTSISGYGTSATIKIPQITVDEYGHVRAGADENVTITMPSAQSIPTTLKNPNSLSFGTKSYDGSSPQTITAADLGLDSALKFHGTSKTAITDGSTTKTVTLSDDSSHTAENGCVLFYGSKEFVWNGTKWEELGNEGNYKVKQTDVASPSEDGSTTAFIDTISQNTNGVITVTKKNLAAATNSVIGGLKLYNAAKTTTVTPNSATTTSDRYYAVELDKDGNAFVNVPWTNTDTNTKNTTGTTNKASTKLYLAGATSQAASPQTYSNSKCYVGTDNCLYSNGSKVLTSYTDTTYDAGTGLSLNGTTFNHSNSVTAVETAGLYKVKYDAQGHITGTATITKDDITGLGIPGSDTNTTYSAGEGLSLSGTTFSHADTNTNISADTSYGPSDNVTQSAKNTATFTVPQITLDQFGHVKSVTERTITVTDTDTNTNTDTKNTTGTTNKTGTKLYLAGATSQAANPQTYSNGNCYIGTDNCLYSNGSKVLTSYTDTVYTAGTNISISSNNVISATDTTYSNFVKSGANAAAGLVPKPSTTAGTTKYLREDGTWQVPPDNNTTYDAGTGLSLSGTTFSHADTNTNINEDTSYGPTEDVTQSAKNTATFKVPQITLDQFGHVKSVTERTIQVTDTDTNTNTDTKNTTGTTNKASTKLYLAGAATQAANPQTYSNSNCYIGTDNCLYSNGSKVLTSYTDTTYDAGDGITISTDNQISAKLRNTTKDSRSSTNATSTDNRVYAIEMDKDGYLAVVVPWSNTTYTSLKNPNSISFKNTSNVTKSYDGSSALDLTGGVYYAATSGSATSAGKLSATSKTAWGQTYWTSGGVPTSISGNMSSVGNITMSGNIKMGDATISYDSTEKCIKFSF